jgi:hypothetical protein
MDLFGGVLPLDKIFRFLLNDKFSKYLKTKITKDQSELDLPSGTLNVRGIELNPSVFNTGRKAIVLRAARIGNVQIQMAGKVVTSVFVFGVVLIRVTGCTELLFRYSSRQPKCQGF